MSFSLDEIFCYTGQLIVAAKKKVPKALGVGAAKVEHTAYIAVSYTHLRAHET